jgi:alpha-tubulin suppressor-like RCC1 family protein
MKNSQIKVISCGCDHSIFLKTNGDIFVCGNNFFGQLGLGDNLPRKKLTFMDNFGDVNKIVCGGLFSFILLKSGDLMVFGSNRNGELGLGDNEGKKKNEKKKFY